MNQYSSFTHAFQTILQYYNPGIPYNLYTLFTVKKTTPLSQLESTLLLVYKCTFLTDFVLYKVATFSKASDIFD